MVKTLSFFGIAIFGLTACSSGREAQDDGENTALAINSTIIRADGPGRQIFERQCAPCHGDGPGGDGTPSLPGTTALTAKYDGAMPGLLELRDDLNGDVLRLFLRNGVGAMPAFRKAELSDGDINQIADYLKATAQKNR